MEHKYKLKYISIRSKISNIHSFNVYMIINESNIIFQTKNPRTRTTIVLSYNFIKEFESFLLDVMNSNTLEYSHSLEFSFLDYTFSINKAYNVDFYYMIIFDKIYRKEIRCVLDINEFKYR